MQPDLDQLWIEHSRELPTAVTQDASAIPLAAPAFDMRYKSTAAPAAVTDPPAATSDSPHSDLPVTA